MAVFVVAVVFVGMHFCVLVHVFSHVFVELCARGCGEFAGVFVVVVLGDEFGVLLEPEVVAVLDVRDLLEVVVRRRRRDRPLEEFGHPTGRRLRALVSWRCKRR